MDQKSVIGLAVTHTQSQIHSPGARTTFSMFRLVIYASKGLFHCESKSIWDGAHLLNFLPRQLNMTFNCHDSVHTQFILSPVLFMVHNNANMISYTTLKLKQFIKDTETNFLAYFLSFTCNLKVGGSPFQY